MGQVDYPQVALLVVGCLLLGGLVWGVSTSTASLGPYNYDWDGGTDLRTTLEANTSVAVSQSTTTYEETEPAETVAIVVGPDGAYSDTDRARLASFVTRGGTVVVASASPETNALLAQLGATVRIDGQPVRDEEQNYRNGALPRATDVRDHERMRDVDALTLNHGTVLESGEATQLVNTSTLAYLDTNRNETLDDNETLGSYPVAAVEAVGDGEVIVVSDESLLTNAMLDREGNRQFVQNLAADHDRAVLDYSQQSLPPLSFAFLQFRADPLVQFVLGIGAVGAIALWGRRLPVHRLRQRLDSRASTADSQIQPDEQQLAASLARNNPDWDDRRVRRVTKAIIRQQRQEGDND